MDFLAKNKTFSLLYQAVEQSYLRHFKKGEGVEIALSGGIDSQVLLDVLSHLQKRNHFKLSAVHVHHGLQPQAHDWVVFCQQQCALRAIPLRMNWVQPRLDSGKGVEAAAREARYRILEETASPIVALAHHQDDQLETLLLGLLRGGGLKSLVGMEEVRPLGKGKSLWRPLLYFPKSLLQRYAEEQRLSYVQDPSNYEKRYTRNWVRQSLLPFIHKEIPDVRQRLLSQMEDFKRSNHLIQQMCHKELERARCGSGLSLNYLVGLTQEERQEILAAFIADQGLGVARKASIYTFSQHLVAKPSFYEWSLPYGKLYVSKGKLWPWAENNPWIKKIIEGNYIWQDFFTREQEKKFSLSKEEGFTVRKVKIDDKILTMRGETGASTLLKSRGVPRFIRPHWPIIVDVRQKAVALPGVQGDRRFFSPREEPPLPAFLRDYLPAKVKEL